jgi:ribosomal peptide maturation radical SAM protein 1
MPFFSVFHPNIGLGLLKAELHAQDIACDVHYLNVECAEWVGIFEYNFISHSPYNALLGEWVFSGALFGDAAPDPDRYIRDMLETHYSRQISSAMRKRLRQIYDSAGQFLERCLSQTDWGRYDIIGLGSSFQQSIPALAFAQVLKQHFPRTTIIMGGSNCEGEMGLTLLRNFPFLDAVFSGEADATLPRFIQDLRSGQRLGPIDGIFHRLSGQEAVPERWTSPIDDLGALPYPDYDDYFARAHASPLWSSIKGPVTPMVCLETSRGCWWGAKQHCTFCGLNGSTMRYRSKTPQRALDEMVALHERYGCFLQVVDNILDLKYIDTVFPELAKRKLDIRLFYETKVNLDRRQLQTLRDAGVVALQPGIESLSTGVLRLMRKGCTTMQNVQFLKWCKELGIDPGWNVIWGFPGEDPADYAAMMRLVERIHHLPPPKATNKLELHRFSPYFTAPESLGAINTGPLPAYSHIYPFPRDVLSGLAYFFTFDYLDGRKPEEYAAPLVQKVRDWQRAEGAVQILYADADGVLELLRIGWQKQPTAAVRLRGPERRVYQLCDRACGLRSICEYLGQSDPAAIARVKAWLDGMVDQGLILEEDGRYLSMAVRAKDMAAFKSQERACTGLLELDAGTLNVAAAGDAELPEPALPLSQGAPVIDVELSALRSKSLRAN